mmetsp:Transcript_33374/g.84557  ORF Transcript_33374/g.84557 Transcript_33374/m.84557 type:complete len:866 (-) Transcript_33374:212-2809(-)
MAMEIVRVVEQAHESEIVSLAYNRARKEIYSCADGDRTIKVWDSRNGQLLRVQQGHKGMVTCVNFSNIIRLLFSGSIDNTVGIWTEKGVNLQMVSVGGPVFSLAWDDRRRFLIVGGHSVINIYKVDMGEARKMSQQQRSVTSGIKDSTGGPGASADMPQILRRVYQPLKGPELCHSDVVKCIVVTDTGKIMSGGFDKAICIYEFDKLDKPREAFQRMRKCHTAAIVSMAYDHTANCILSGSIDGSMKVWSMEGRLLDKFENINDQPVCAAYVPPINMYWASGRFGRLVAYDPRAPSNVTEYVRDANSLDRFRVSLLFAPLGTDMLLGATRQGQLIMWQHNKQAAYRMFRKHEDWVEAVVVVPVKGADDADADEIFSAGADGKVLRWQLDTEENCDIYECIEEIQLHTKNIHAITYSPALGCLVTGGEDALIRVHYLSGQIPTFNDVPLPTSITDHEARVTGLALLKNNLLASVSFDRSLRIWDLTTMKTVAVVPGAHDTPIQCLEYCPERDELATCGMGNKVKVWDVKRPSAVRPKLVLNHADHDAADSDDEEGGSRARKTNMMWLTRSDMPNLPTATNPLVEETIKKAARDVPEVTQVRWVGYRGVWATAADDDMLRLWGTDGTKLHQFAYTGGSVQALYVDNVNKLLVAAMLDKAVCVYDLDDPIPRATYKGHTDVVRGISYLHSADCYITASWDKSLRLWFTPGGPRHGAGVVVPKQPAGGLKEGAGLGLGGEEEEDEEHFVSSYEKAHPLEVPRALTEANQWQLLKAIGVLEDDKVGKKGRARAFKVEDAREDETRDDPGTLGAKLNDLGKELLHEINAMARQRKIAMDHTDAGSAAGSGAERVPIAGRRARPQGLNLGKR